MKTVKRSMKTVALSFLLLSASAFSSDFYIATDGNDANPGTKQKPFRTLEAARNAVRTCKNSKNSDVNGVTVWVRGGTYQRTQSFELTGEDSGSAGKPIVYRAYKNEQVCVSGGKELASKHFTVVKDPATLDRLDTSARGKVFQIDLKSQGVTDFGNAEPITSLAMELFFNSEPMTLARWPNEGWSRIAGIPQDSNGSKFLYKGNRPDRWKNTDDIWLHGYWLYDWSESYIKIESIDRQNREFKGKFGVKADSAMQRYYALNILEELDRPGEWYLCRKSGILYFWPPTPIRKGQAVVSMLREPIVSFKNASYITIQGMTLECTRDGAVRIEGGTHNLIAGCVLRNCGKYGVSINTAASESGAAGCDIYNIGEGGIILQGGDRLTLTAGGNFAINNHIHHLTRLLKTYQPAVNISGVGNKVAHNLMHDSTHCAVLMYGNDHVFEWNEIHNVGMATNDAGALYVMGRDPTQRGNIIRCNYFHDLGIGDIRAIYLDDYSCGNMVYGNVLLRAGMGVCIGGGRDNTVENNIFIDCRPAVHVDSRGINWAKFWFDPNDKNNLLVPFKATIDKYPVYTQRYPELSKLLDDEPAWPKGNSVIHNVATCGRWLLLWEGLDPWTNGSGSMGQGGREIVKVKDNFLIIDPAENNIHLTDDSPAYEMGFKRIPIEQIGLYTDEYRHVLPKNGED
jgi:parallel beta-helix repeat protein